MCCLHLSLLYLTKANTIKVTFILLTKFTSGNSTLSANGETTAYFSGLINAAHMFEFPESIQPRWDYRMGCAVRSDNLHDLLESAKKYKDHKITKVFLKEVFLFSCFDIPCICVRERVYSNSYSVNPNIQCLSAIRHNNVIFKGNERKSVFNFYFRFQCENILLLLLTTWVFSRISSKP